MYNHNKKKESPQAYFIIFRILAQTLLLKLLSVDRSLLVLRSQQSLIFGTQACHPWTAQVLHSFFRVTSNMFVVQDAALTMHINI